MHIRLKRKDTRSLLPTDIIFQTFYWSQVKLRLGWKAVAFDFVSPEIAGDLLVLMRSLGDSTTVAYVPQGPEFGPETHEYGPFLEALSDEIMARIDRPVAFIRYDLPWESQYAAGVWPGHPETRLRELRMNFGTRSWNLRKAVTDLTVADILRLDLKGGEEFVLRNMKPKTRYNIRLARKKGVEVFPADTGMLPLFYGLYCETASRNGFPLCGYSHFSALFSSWARDPGSADCHFLLAAQGPDLLAGAIVTISGQTATYLFGASSSGKRNLMGSYAIQWEAIRLAVARGCLVYDMGAVAPTEDPAHPFHGMHRFKTGFGGTIVHLNGSWDYPFHEGKYAGFRNAETLGRVGIG